MEENTKSSFVVDASFVTAFLLPDEEIPEVEDIFTKLEKKEVSLCAPKLIPFEVLLKF